MRSWIVGVLILMAADAGAELRVRPIDWAQPVIGFKIDNFYKIDEAVYRSEQPNSKDMKALEEAGIRSALNLREYHSDADEAKGTHIQLYRVAMNAGEIYDTLIAKALYSIDRAKKPILIHCWHGSDRTGAVVAMYRMVFQNWPREKAIDEFKNGGFGYHEWWYPNIENYLKTVDIEKMKKAIASSGQ